MRHRIVWQVRINFWRNCCPHFLPAYEGSKFVLNVGTLLPNCTAPHPRRPCREATLPQVGWAQNHPVGIPFRASCHDILRRIKAGWKLRGVT
jgi:hypothetical protein